MGKKTLIIIAGPTAVGKTSFAIGLANHFKTHIFSADSRQFYREMNIGTAKPSASELAAAPHHFINNRSITENFTVGEFEREVLHKLDELFKTHDFVVLVGGSGLFINAVIKGFDEIPASPPEIRQMLNALLRDKGLDHLLTMLKDADPDYYTQVDHHNPQRIIRGLEVFLSSGNTLSSLHRKISVLRPFEIKTYGLNLDRPELYRRIDERVEQMIAGGLIEEARALVPYRHLNALNTVGYSELFDYFDGKHSLEKAVELIKQNSRRYAKRQITWFKKTDGIAWITPNDIGRVIRDNPL